MVPTAARSRRRGAFLNGLSGVAAPSDTLFEARLSRWYWRTATFASGDLKTLRLCSASQQRIWRWRRFRDSGHGLPYEASMTSWNLASSAPSKKSTASVFQNIEYAVVSTGEPVQKLSTMVPPLSVMVRFAWLASTAIEAVETYVSAPYRFAKAWTKRSCTSTSRSSMCGWILTTIGTARAAPHSMTRSKRTRIVRFEYRSIETSPMCCVGTKT
mmetsp:Transcript_10691/g.43241  ORF Transcript_10691/g.43241 Transcript_10691/m.43241 type:complete len:214 (+) Transcript_10691:998-1639(+)